MAKYHSERCTERGAWKLRHLRENDGCYVTKIFFCGFFARSESEKDRERTVKGHRERERERKNFHYSHIELEI